MVVTSAVISGHFARLMRKKDAIAKEDKEGDETMRGGSEAELAADLTHLITRRMRKALPFKEGFFHSALNAGKLRTEETTGSVELLR